MNLIINNYIDSFYYKKPQGKLIYSPRNFCSFSPQGEKMVQGLIETSPQFHNIFNKMIPLEKQKELCERSFNIQKEIYLSEKLEKEKLIQLDETLSKNKEFSDKIEKSLDPTGKRTGKKYFETNRKFNYLVPNEYLRTEAPRLSAIGSTFHGMKKNLTACILTELLEELKAKGLGVSICDLDMSAAHARFAVRLQEKSNSQLYEAVVYSGKFWDEKAAYYFEKFQNAGLPFQKSQVRAMLKIFLYTSLNGGNPLGPERLYKTIKDQDESFTASIVNLNQFQGSSLYIDVKGQLSDFALLEEVKNLNQKCVTEDTKRTWTINSTQGYNVDSNHKGISRALQGFEVIFLTLLVNKVLKRGALPLNLAHDGALFLFPGKVDEKALCLELTEELQGWSDYLLDGLPLPIECKFNITNLV